MHGVCPSESYIHLPEKMDHNEFLLEEDLVEPFRAFLLKLGHDVAVEDKPSGMGTVQSTGGEKEEVLSISPQAPGYSKVQAKPKPIP